MQSVIDPCKIIKETIVKYIDKDISSNVIFVKRSTEQDTDNMKGFWIGFKGFAQSFTIRVNKMYDEESLRQNAWAIAFNINKPDFKLK